MMTRKIERTYDKIVDQVLLVVCAAIKINLRGNGNQLLYL